MNRLKLSMALPLLLLFPATFAWASYAIFVGKNLTADGSTFLGGTGDEPSSHWLEIVPRKTHAPGETIQVGVTSKANYPGELIQIPQVPLDREVHHDELQRVRWLPGAADERRPQ